MYEYNIYLISFFNINFSRHLDRIGFKNTRDLFQNRIRFETRIIIFTQLMFPNVDKLLCYKYASNDTKYVNIFSSLYTLLMTTLHVNNIREQVL